MTIEISGATKITDTSSNQIKAIKSLTQTISSITEYTSNIVSVAPSTVDLALPLTLVGTSKFVLIASDIAISVKLNSATTPITIAAGGSLVLNGGVTSISVSNDSVETAANVEFIVAS